MVSLSFLAKRLSLPFLPAKGVGELSGLAVSLAGGLADSCPSLRADALCWPSCCLVPLAARKSCLVLHLDFCGWTRRPLSPRDGWQLLWEGQNGCNYKTDFFLPFVGACCRVV